VYSVCVSADGSRLFSGSGDNSIKVWNIPVSQVSSSSSSMSSAAALSSEVPDATSPKTNAVLPNTTLTPNHELRTRCLEWKELHSTEAGFKKQLIAITGALVTAETPADALAAVSKIGDLLELARSQNFLILGSAGVSKLLNQAQFTNAVDDQVASAFAVLQSQSAAHVGEFQEKYRHLQTERSANAAAAQTFAGSDEAILRDMTKAERKEAVAKRKVVAAQKKLDAAQAAWEKTTAAVRSAQKSLETNAKEKQSFGKLEEDLAAQSKAVIKMLEAVGEQVNDEAQAVEGGEGGASSSSSSSSSGSTSKRKGRGSSSRSSTRVSKRAKKGRKN
jgi:hypothetical protein